MGMCILGKLRCMLYNIIIVIIMEVLGTIVAVTEIQMRQDVTMLLIGDQIAKNASHVLVYCINIDVLCN